MFAIKTKCDKFKIRLAGYQFLCFPQYNGSYREDPPWAFIRAEVWKRVGKKPLYLEQI